LRRELHAQNAGLAQFASEFLAEWIGENRRCDEHRLNGGTFFSSPGNVPDAFDQIKTAARTASGALQGKKMLEPGVLCILNQRLRLFVFMHGLDAATWAAAIRWICPQLLHAISKRASREQDPKIGHARTAGVSRTPLPAFHRLSFLSSRTKWTKSNHAGSVTRRQPLSPNSATALNKAGLFGQNAISGLDFSLS
jgi:hypothetical protein